MSQLSLHDLSFSYSDGTPALQQVALNLESGTRTALVGPNGAGKTSLLLAVAGLIHFTGRVQIDGTSMTDQSQQDLRKGMSFVFQNPDEMLFMPTVLEDVCFGLDTLGLVGEAIQERARQALEAVSLAGFEQRSAQHLSYGERRRVTLATALARRSSLTLFDEPTRELDPYGRRNFIQLFQSLPGTLVLASHDLELVLETCSAMVLLDKGRIVAQGVPRQLLADKDLMTAHRLEVPHSLIRHPHAHDLILKIENRK